MLKRLAVVLALAYSLILTGYTPAGMSTLINGAHADEVTKSYRGLDDPSLLSDFEDTLLAYLGSELGEGYYLTDIQARYVSQEYLDEVAYNSQENIYFGYTLPELDEYFADTRYIFTLGNDGTTVVQALEDYDDVFGQVVRDVALGTGVILFTVTISAIAPAASAPAAVTLLLAASAKSATIMAGSSALIGAVIGGAAAAIEGGDTDAVMKAAALEGAAGLKFGAVIGAVTGPVFKIGTAKDAAQALSPIVTTGVVAGTVSKYGVPYALRMVATVNGRLVKCVVPIFKPAYTVTLPKSVYLVSNRADHAKHCNRVLAAAAKADTSLATKLGLSSDDIAKMLKDGTNPKGYVWHHSEELGVMQLIDETIHSGTKHYGGYKLWYL